MEATRCIGERYGQSVQHQFRLGDAAAMMPELIKEYAGKVQMIYLDPPFSTGEAFQYRVQLDNRKLGTLTLSAYQDDMPEETYFIMMRTILEGCYTLLSEEGSLYLHVDFRTGAYFKIMLDEIFGRQNFLNEIIWHYKSGGRAKSYFSRKHDTIYFYRKSRSVYFDITAVGVPRGKEMKNHMKRTLDENGRLVYTIKSAGKTYTYSEDAPVYPSDVWTDISHLQQKDPERTGYDTQKPEALLRRILSASSREGDLVMDLFSGSGTTAAVALSLNRRFLVVDQSPLAMQVLRRRVLQRETTLMELGGPNVQFCYDPSLLKQLGNLKLSCRRENGRADVMLCGYEPPESCNPPVGVSGLQLIDFCAIGFLEKEHFFPYSFHQRPKRAGKIATGYFAPDRKGLALLVADVFGNQQVYRL